VARPGHGAVRPAGVVEALVLPQHRHQVALVQIRVRSSSPRRQLPIQMPGPCCWPGIQRHTPLWTTDSHRLAAQPLAGRWRAFTESPWGRKYPQAARVWEAAWNDFTPFLAFSPPVRKMLYTTNSIESLNYQLRKVTKARGHFPGDDAVVKLLWLAIINIEDKRAREREARRRQTGKRSDQPARIVEGQRVMGWREALGELDIAYPGRLR
jgi:putative transposase